MANVHAAGTPQASDVIGIAFGSLTTMRVLIGMATKRPDNADKRDYMSL